MQSFTSVTWWFSSCRGALFKSRQCILCLNEVQVLESAKFLSLCNLVEQKHTPITHERLKFVAACANLHTGESMSPNTNQSEALSVTGNCDA
jgi:hypothetical protein